MKNRMTLMCAGILLLLMQSTYALDTGDYVKVSWKGKWYDASIIDRNDASFRIHYSGYDSSWDEWITASRIRIEVYWKGKWYPATALESSGSRIRVHYTGYDSSWDEWATLDRVRSY